MTLGMTSGRIGTPTNEIPWYRKDSAELGSEPWPVTLELPTAIRPGRIACSVRFGIVIHSRRPISHPNKCVGVMPCAIRGCSLRRYAPTDHFPVRMGRTPRIAAQFGANAVGPTLA